MSRQRRHTMSGPQPSMQEFVTADSQILPTNCSSSATWHADHEMIDAATQTSDQPVDIANMPPPTGANNDLESLPALAQSRSNGIAGLTKAFTQLGTSDEARSDLGPNTRSNPIPHTPSNLRPDTPSFTATVPLAANGWYNLREHLPQEKTAIIMNGLDPRTLTRFVETLEEDGYLNIDDDELFIDAVGRVLIMAMAFQQLTNPAELKLPPDVINKISTDVHKAIVLCGGGAWEVHQWFQDVATKLRGFKDM
ncbi:hypothetical protein QBC45DRAFT_319173 [Copromyces sp. CBS 386.78]|nr:hypothetical protein QBC45DRAFT_319173 [Copromyces sp. CBS 386.78]